MAIAVEIVGEASRSGVHDAIACIESQPLGLCIEINAPQAWRKALEQGATGYARELEERLPRGCRSPQAPNQSTGPPQHESRRRRADFGLEALLQCMESLEDLASFGLEHLEPMRRLSRIGNSRERPWRRTSAKFRALRALIP